MDAAWLAVMTGTRHLRGAALAAGSWGPIQSRALVESGKAGLTGVAALVLTLLLKASALTIVSQRGAWQILVLAPCLARWGLNLLAAGAPHAGLSGGLGEATAGSRGRLGLLIAGPTALGAAWSLGEASGAWAFAGVTAWSLAMVFFCRKGAGGVTEDILGAQVEVTETFLLLAWAAALGKHA